MRRREFLKTTATGASAVAAGGALAAGGMLACARDGDDRGGGTAGDAAGSDAAGGAPAVHTTKHVRWRLASSFPRGLDTIYGAAEVLAARLDTLSGGRFEVRPYPAGEIVPPLQVLDAVQQGTVHIGQTASYYFTGKNPALAFDTCVPFGLTARQQTAWLLEGGGLELIHELLADFNIVSFPSGNTGAQMGGWFQREIATPEDLRGLKFRIPGLGGEVMSRLGSTVQVLAGGDIFPALERGTIDATEWVGPYDDEKLGFYKVARFYYYPGWWEPGPSLSFYVNRDAWNGLPGVDQELFRTAAREAAGTMQARYDARNPAALARLLANGVELRRFSPAIMAAAEAAATDIMEEAAAGDATYRRVYETWSKARRELFDWFGTAELAYAEAAFSRRS
ncbi:MAG: TRAP transporter substrate-binding protein [Candidatus Eiseniibacteriota bacterium]|jgi:TRAP-type mannitol/chloroaromatic compound transport system substrate-binding protein